MSYIISVNGHEFVKRLRRLGKALGTGLLSKMLAHLQLTKDDLK